MGDLTALVLAGFAGLLLGAIFFGGLWWTVRRSVVSMRPALWVFVSLLLRLGIVMVGFHFVGQGDWRRLLACLVGFVLARILATWFSALSAVSEKEATREPQS